MQKLIRPGLLFFTLAAFAVGCGSNSNPRAIDVKIDTRLKRVGEGAPEEGKSNQNNQALPQ
jgi:hypothetical protein